MAQGDVGNGKHGEGGSFKEKLFLLIFDKVALGFAAAFVAYLFTVWQQHDQMTMDCQRALFDSRRGAYVAILTKAKEARDAASLFFGSHLYPPPSSLTDKDYAWRLQLAEVRKRLNNPKLGISVGGQDFWFDQEEKTKQGLDALAQLEALEQVRIENALYVSEEIDGAVDRFITTLTRDIEPFSTEYAPDKSDPSSIAEHGFKDAFEAYDALRQAICKSLRVNEIILG
jgi:hypothetical protein